MKHKYKLGDKVKVRSVKSHCSSIKNGEICTVTKHCFDDVYIIDNLTGGIFEDELTKVSTNTWKGGKR